MDCFPPLHLPYPHQALLFVGVGRLEDAAEALAAEASADDALPSAGWDDEDGAEPVAVSSRGSQLDDHAVAATIASLEKQGTNYDLIAAVVAYICDQQQDGAILIFLPGLAEIKR